MPHFLYYLEKLSISLGLVWLFYQLLLRRLTFYHWNRWYLLGYSLLSFVIACIDVNALLTDHSSEENGVIYLIPRLYHIGAAVDPLAASRRRTIALLWQFALLILLAGTLLLLVRLCVRWISLRRIRNNARLVRSGNINIYQVDGPVLPFSFGRSIYINPQLHTEKEWEEIILHEYIHIRQHHTMDILFAEILCAINWYNPFAWLIRYSIKQNLEFIADNKVLEKGMDKKSYQYHLLKVMGTPRYQLANNFNFSSLKKRIIMMNTSKSTRIHLLKFLFIWPLLGILLVAFREFHGRTIELPAPSTLNLSSPAGAGTGETNPAWSRNISAPVTPHARMQTGQVPLVVVPDTIPAKGVAIVIRDTIDLSGPLPENPLYYLDGVLISPVDMNAVKPSDIEYIRVLKGEEAIRSYGEKGRNGVVIISTRHNSNKVNIVPDAADKAKIVPDDIDKAKIVPDDTYKAKIVPDAAGADTKTSTVKTISIQFTANADDVNRGLPQSDDVDARKKSADKLSSIMDKALVFVDGKEIAHEELAKLDVATIASVSVLKDASAIKKYGERAKDGVILIKTRQITKQD